MSIELIRPESRIRKIIANVRTRKLVQNGNIDQEDQEVAPAPPRAMA
jgi:hypothetical protein